jgi:hypothetical protein
LSLVVVQRSSRAPRCRAMSTVAVTRAWPMPGRAGRCRRTRSRAPSRSPRRSARQSRLGRWLPPARGGWSGRRAARARPSPCRPMSGAPTLRRRPPHPPTTRQRQPAPTPAATERMDQQHGGRIRWSRSWRVRSGQRPGSAAPGAGDAQEGHEPAQ